MLSKNFITFLKIILYPVKFGNDFWTTFIDNLHKINRMKYAKEINYFYAIIYDWLPKMVWNVAAHINLNLTFS